MTMSTFSKSTQEELARFEVQGLHLQGCTARVESTLREFEDPNSLFKYLALREGEQAFILTVHGESHEHGEVLIKKYSNTS